MSSTHSITAPPHPQKTKGTIHFLLSQLHSNSHWPSSPDL
ncbi:mCG1041812 [Mus musculus]|nr:mCG1041812 [Mus musculus]